MAAGDELPPGEVRSFDDLAKAIAGALSQVSDFTFLKVVPTNFIADTIALFLTLPLKLLADVVVLAAKTMLALLQTQRAETSELASVALSEVFGTPVRIGGGGNSFGGGDATNLGRSILERFLPVLTGGEAKVGPTAEPAERFLGELLGVSVRAWLLEFISDLMPEAVRIAPFNDLVDSVLGSTGVSRLARVALRPAIQVAVAEPLQWLVLDTLRPTLLSEGQAVKTFLSGKWTRQQLDDELGAKGFSFDRQEAIIASAEKGLSISDVRVLVKNKAWTDEQAVTLLSEQGIPNGNVRAMLDVGVFQEIDALRPRAIAAFELQWKRGVTDDSGFTSALAALNIRPEVAAFWLQILHAEKAAGFRVLDVSQLNKARDGNVISAPEWRAGLELLGYSTDDVTVLELTEQGALASREAAAAAKVAQKQKAAADKAAAKEQAAADKAARVAAAADAKAKTAQTRIDRQKEHTTTLLARQTLLAQQAQARRDQIATAKAAALITAQQEQIALAQVSEAERAAAITAASHTQIQTTLDQAATNFDQLEITVTVAAEAARRDAAAATELAANQEAALVERRAERITLFHAERDKVDLELDRQLITQKEHDRKILDLTVSEQAAVRAERLDELAIARARKQAEGRSAAAQAAAAKAARGQGLVPTSTARRTATIASAAAAKSTLSATTLSARTGTQAKIAADRAAATLEATRQVDALNAQLLEQLKQFEIEHAPKP
jgi:hypothetical protein